MKKYILLFSIVILLFSSLSLEAEAFGHSKEELTDFNVDVSKNLNQAILIDWKADGVTDLDLWVTCNKDIELYTKEGDETYSCENGKNQRIVQYKNQSFNTLTLTPQNFTDDVKVTFRLDVIPDGPVISSKNKTVVVKYEENVNVEVSSDENNAADEVVDSPTDDTGDQENDSTGVTVINSIINIIKDGKETAELSSADKDLIIFLELIIKLIS